MTALETFISERHRRAIDEGRARYVGSYHLVPIIEYQEIEMPLHPSTFQHLKPSDEQLQIMAVVREDFDSFAARLDANLPDGPDKTYVMRKLREVGMWSNIAIARHPDGSPRT